ncbi:tetratricopeptide repeat protein, partial [uncultured Prevotella sp.]|uniref:tetratricopeptide repeat protein n=1 Tax=uncultured Prevotella sp. TaxID=159272 RepID=UPI0035A720A5
MSFLKKIFGVSSDSKEQTQEEKQAEEKKNFEILKYDGVRALKTQQTDYAVECFRHALDIKDDLEIHDYLSQAYMTLGDLPKAYEQLQKLAEAQPDNIDIFVRMAHVAYMMEDYVVMGSACEKALLIDKDSPRALYLYA